MAQPVNLREQITRDEGGVKLSAYQDSRGLWTVGVGHCIQTRPISRAAAEKIFEDDLADTMGELNRELPWAIKLGDRRYAVLVSMAFQMGVGGLLGFPRFLAAMEKRDFIGAAAHGRASAWAREQTPERADRLMRQVESDSWV